MHNALVALQKMKRQRVGMKSMQSQARENIAAFSHDASPEVTIVLPAFNEQEDLPALIDSLGTTLSGQGISFRILVVDDGSSDQTRAIALYKSQSWPVDVVSHPRNFGLGAALRTGLLRAVKNGGIVVTMDADNSHDPALIKEMVARIRSGHDVVIASRFRSGGRVVGVRWHRRLLSATASSLFRLIVRCPSVRDYSSGYRAYRAETVRDIQRAYGDKFLEENGFACMFELLLKLRKIGANITEVPLVLRYDRKSGASKCRVIPTIARYGAVLFSGFSLSSEASPPREKVSLSQ